MSKVIGQVRLSSTPSLTVPPNRVLSPYIPQVVVPLHWSPITPVTNYIPSRKPVQLDRSAETQAILAKIDAQTEVSRIITLSTPITQEGPLEDPDCLELFNVQPSSTISRSERYPKLDLKGTYSELQNRQFVARPLPVVQKRNKYRRPRHSTNVGNISDPW